MVRCCDSTLYTGITTDLFRRFKEHNTSIKGARYTSKRRPVVLVYYEVSENRSTATKREFQIKRMSKQQKEDLIK
jgi:putative endonuclease